MLFETERKANDFIKWNGDNLDVAEGCELRAYYCPSCCGWHITHQRHRRGYDRNTDRLIDAFNKSKGNKMKKIEIREAVSKNVLKDYLTTYFAENGINDSGRIRKAVYTLWGKQYRR